MGRGFTTTGGGEVALRNRFTIMKSVHSTTTEGYGGGNFTLRDRFTIRYDGDCTT